MGAVPNPPIDYLSRDYASLRSDMIDGIPSRVPEWTSRNQNDFGIALIELFAYMGDGLHYYADRIANEAFLQTATQRSSVLSFARLLDYRPAGNQAATVPLVFANATDAPVTVPRGTRVSTPTTDAAGNAVYFETVADVPLLANSQAQVDAVEGVTVPLEALGTSDGSLTQDFVLRQAPVIDGSVTVSVSEAAASIWDYYEHLIDAEPQDTAYTRETDDRGLVHVVFGDGVNGKIPAPGSPVRAAYRVGGGIIGNIGPGQLTRIVTTVPPGVTVTNQEAATGGADAETLSQIKVNAPRSLYALRRAVAVRDYALLAVEVPEVGKAQAIQTSASSVTLFVVPRAGGPVLPELRDKGLAYLEDKKPANVTVTVSSPEYVATNISVIVNVAPQYLRERVRQVVLKALKTLLDLDNVILGDRISVSDIYSLIMRVEGVTSLTLRGLDRDGVSPDPSSPDAVFFDYEVPREGLLVIDVTGGISV